MDGNDQVSSREIASTLNSLGETTTAAELVRKQGQSKKLKVISEKKLMEWILSLLQQHMAGKADAFSDAEKEELLRKTQEELKRRMLREQSSDAERARVQGEYESALRVLHDAKASQADIEAAMQALQAKLENAEANLNDLQQDNYDLQDQLQEKMALLSTTLAEKEKLRDTVRNQMIHSGELIGGVLGLDNSYYGGRHQEHNAVSEDASQDEQFYHDFNTGAQVIQTLMTDLERLRGIAKQSLAAKEAAEHDPRSNLLESDLSLLEQLRSGNLKAMDVSQPVATLIEALDGARTEAEAMEDAVAAVTGNTSKRSAFTALPDSDGEASEVLAGAAVVARELAAEIARSKDRVLALKQIADDADLERSTSETEAAALREASERLLTSMREKADQDRLAIPAEIADLQAPPLKRVEAALDILAQLHAGSPQATQAMSEHLQLIDRLAGTAHATLVGNAGNAGGADQADLIEHLRLGGSTLEQVVLSQKRELESSIAREMTLAQHIQSLAASSARTGASQSAAPSPELTRSSDRLRAALSKEERDAKIEAAEAAVSVVDALQRQSQAEAAEHERELALLREELTKSAQLQRELDQAREELAGAQALARTHVQAHRTIAAQLLKAAKGDDGLADASADLAVAMDQAHDEHSSQPGSAGHPHSGTETFSKQLQESVTALAGRKQEIQREAEQLASRLEQAKAEQERATAASDQAINRERALAHALVNLGSTDPELAEAVADLAVALEEVTPGEPVPTDLRAHLTAAMSTLTQRKQALAARNTELERELAALKEQHSDASERASGLEKERDEMALSGKEIIGQLRTQKDTREKELIELREENELAAKKLEEFQGRMTKAEAASRRLAEALSAVAGVETKHDFHEAPSIEDPRMDLEVALSQLPAEEESEGLATTGEISAQIAESGHKLAEALTHRRLAAAAAMAHAQAERQRLLAQIERIAGESAQHLAQLEERDSSLKRNQSELVALRREMGTQGAALAGSVQELSTARSDLASARADLDTARERVHDHEQNLSEARTRIGEHQRQIEQLQADHGNALTRAQAAEQIQSRLTQALHQLAGPSGAQLNDPLAKAAQKLELARQGAGEEIGSAGEALIEAARGHAQQLQQSVDSGRLKLSQSSSELSQLRDELANQRAALVDREHALQSAKSELETLGQERAQTQTHLHERKQSLLASQQRIATLEEQLRQAEAELEGHRAREGASSGGLEDELTQLRGELSKEHQTRKDLEAVVHDQRERADAADVRLKRQRDEFTRRLEERDRLIQDKDRLLDEHASHKVDSKGLEAQLAALTTQLAAASERIQELESFHGAHAGATTKSGDLARELKKAHGDRDQLRERQRQLESDLADAVSAQEELQTQLEEKRKEVGSAREEMSKELAEERLRSANLKEEFRRLKEDVVGLRARLRRLTEDKH